MEEQRLKKIEEERLKKESDWLNSIQEEERYNKYIEDNNKRTDSILNP